MGEKKKKKNYCCICRSESIFEDFGDPKRENVLCSKCFSLERHRFLYFIYNTLFLKSKENIKVLHMAPEKSLSEAILNNKNIEYVAADLEPSGYLFLDCKKEDFTSLSFADKVFDIILTNHVLEHIEDEAVYLNEMKRCLRDDGIIVLSVPMDKKRAETYEDKKIVSKMERRKVFGQEDHVRIYGNDVFRRLEKVGFKVHQVEEDIFSQNFIQYNKFESANENMLISSGYFILRKKLS